MAKSTPKWDDTEEIVDEAPKWDDTEEMKDKPISKTESILRGAAQGATMGFADELTGGLETAGKTMFGDEKLNNLIDNYRKHRDESEANYDLAEKTNPLSYLAGEVAGGAATVAATGGLAKAGLGAAGLLNEANIAAKGLNAAKIGLAATDAGLSGAIYGVGDSKGDLTKGEFGKVANDAMVGGAAGAVLGGALPIAGSALKSVGKGLGYLGRKAVDFAGPFSTHEELTYVLNNSKKIANAKNSKQLVSDILSARKKLEESYSKHAQDAVNVLDKNKPAISKSELYDILDKKIEKAGTKSSQSSNVKEYDNLKSVIENDFNPNSEFLSEVDLNELKKEVGTIYTSLDSPELKHLYGELNDKMPKHFKDLNTKTARDINLLQDLDKKFGLKTKQVSEDIGGNNYLDVKDKVNYTRNIEGGDKTVSSIKQMLKTDSIDANHIVNELNKMGLADSFISDVKNFGLKNMLDKASSSNYSLKQGIMLGLGGLATASNPIVAPIAIAAMYSKPIVKLIARNWHVMPEGEALKKFIESSAFKQLSKSATLRFTRNKSMMEKYKSVKTESSKNKVYLNSINKAVKYDVNNIDKIYDKVAKSAPSYTKILDKMKNMPDNKKQPLMYSLMQQPAFREAIKDDK